MQEQKELIYKSTSKDEHDKKTPGPSVNNDLDDYIFCQEDIKYQSER